MEQALPANDDVKGRFKYIRKAQRDNSYETPKRLITKPIYSPNLSIPGDYSPGDEDGGDVSNLGLGGDGQRNGVGGGPPGDDELQAVITTDGRGNSNSNKEFQLVNAPRIAITPFSGRTLHTIPYLQVNNGIGRLVLVQGQDGEELLDILDEVEQCGDQKLSREDLREVAKRCLKICKYDRAINVALLNYITEKGALDIPVGSLGGLLIGISTEYLCPCLLALLVLYLCWLFARRSLGVCR